MKSDTMLYRLRKLLDKRITLASGKETDNETIQFLHTDIQNPGEILMSACSFRHHAYKILYARTLLAGLRKLLGN